MEGELPANGEEGNDVDVEDGPQILSTKILPRQNENDSEPIELPLMEMF
jgi:hypothetical protein